jgi:hypothetical protein
VTQTRRWLRHHRRKLLVRLAVGGGFRAVGVLLIALGTGLLLARAGAYRHFPGAALGMWTVVLVVAALGVAPVLRRARELGIQQLATIAEREGQRRAGWIVGAASWSEGAGSSVLARLADGLVVSWLDAEGDRALHRPRRQARRTVRSGVLVFVAGLSLFAAVNPTSPSGREFWQPVATLLRARGPVRVIADRTVVQRGDSVRLQVVARGRVTADLLTRAPGEEWSREEMSLDLAGSATVVLGPLESDRFVRAVSGRRESETVHIEVSLPVLLTALELTARFPAYLDRPDELLPVAADTLWLPRGTRVQVRGRATVPVGSAAWISVRDTVPLRPAGDAFSGDLTVLADARWSLTLRSRDGVEASTPLSLLTVVAVADSVPTVHIPVPGADTVAPITLQQGLLVDARDDHRIRTLELWSWRVSRRGVRDEVVLDSIPLSEAGAARLVLPWLLDLNDRGFVPGDTAFYQVRATDNAPMPHTGLSRVYSLRLPAMSELREAIRGASRAAGTEADSLVEAQRELARRIEDLAAERARAAAARTADAEALPFETAERAGEVLEEQERLAERAASLREEIGELAEAAWTAGLTDPAFQQQLREIGELLDRAMTEELAATLEALRGALERLSAADVRDALQRLAEAADRLRADLTRSRELFERAAVEGDLTTLSADADELAHRQGEWNRTVEQADGTEAVREEAALAEEAERLARELEQLAAAVDSLGMPSDGVERAEDAAREAGNSMQQAADRAQAGSRPQAREAGERASAELDPLGAALRQERDAMRNSWREEVMAQMDRALVETAGLSGRQVEIVGQLRQGVADADVRGAQAAVREGVDRVGRRLQAAAGKNALVPRELGTALGLAVLRMEESLAQLQRVSPSPVDAAALAEEALDALNAAVYAMLRSRDDVASAESGSGLSEALERMAQLAEQQGSMNGQASGLLPLMNAGGSELMQQLQALAAEQRALAQALERLRAEGDVGSAGELAQDAEEVARDLAAGRLDQEVLDRQEQLYRRLLDAGRSLESDDEDQRRDRVSETARPGNVRLPGSGDTPVGASRYPYPAWEELQALSPEERRLVLEYFRRLNRVRP